MNIVQKILFSSRQQASTTPAIIKRLYNGEIIESICAGLPDWRRSLLLQQWHSEDAKKVAQNQDSAIRKLSFEQGMV